MTTAHPHPHAPPPEPAADENKLVTERREEVTTEGGLAVAGHEGWIAPVVKALADAGVGVSIGHTAASHEAVLIRKPCSIGNSEFQRRLHSFIHAAL